MITDLAVSPDNSMLVSSSEDRNLRVWDPRTGATVAVLRGHEAPVNLVRFAPGDSVAMSASEDGTCRVWDLRDRDRYKPRFVLHCRLFPASFRVVFKVYIAYNIFNRFRTWFYFCVEIYC